MTGAVRVLEGGSWRDHAPGDVRPDDRGLLLGDGVFETFRAGPEGVRRSAAHRDRLAAACQALDLEMPDWGVAEAEACRLAAAAPAMLRLTVTRGSGPRGLAPPPEERNRVMLSAAPWSAPPPSLSLHLSAIRRAPESLAARHKTLSYGDNAAARRDAVRQGADMALLLTSGGAVSGADCANVFAIQAGTLLTPSLACAIRDGVTRAAVLALADREGIAVREGACPPDRFLDADALFVTNTALGVVAVRRCGEYEFDLENPLLTGLRAGEAG